MRLIAFVRSSPHRLSPGVEQLVFAKLKAVHGLVCNRAAPSVRIIACIGKAPARTIAQPVPAVHLNKKLSFRRAKVPLRRAGPAAALADLPAQKAAYRFPGNSRNLTSFSDRRACAKRYSFVSSGVDSKQMIAAGVFAASSCK